VAYRIEAGGPTWLELSPDGRLVLPRGTSFRAGSLLGTQVHDAATGKPVGPRLTPGGIVVDASFNPDGTQVAIAALTAQTPDERGRQVFAPDGKAGSVQVWDWKGGKRLVGPIPLPAEPRGLAFRPDGRTLAVVCADYRVVLVDPATGAIRHRLDPGIRTKPFNANLWTTNGEPLFSPDGRFLLTWELVPTLHVWDPDDGRLLQTLEHTERVENAAFNPKSPHVLATGGRDSMLKVWDLSAGKLLMQLQHPRWIQKITFSPDGSELICGCSDGLIRSWNWRTGELNRALPHNIDMISFDFTMDLRWLTVQSMSSLELTDWPSGAPAAPEWSLRNGLLWGCVIAVGDRRVVVGGFDGRIMGFDLEMMVTPAPAPAEDLTRLAEVVAGRRIMTQGLVVPINNAEWTDRWNELQRTGWPRQSLLP